MKLTDEEPIGRGSVKPIMHTVAEWAQVSLEQQKSLILTRGVDYHSSDEAIKTNIYKYAKDNNLRVVTNNKESGQLLVRFYRKDED